MLFGNMCARQAAAGIVKLIKLSKSPMIPCLDQVVFFGWLCMYLDSFSVRSCFDTRAWRRSQTTNCDFGDEAGNCEDWHSTSFSEKQRNSNTPSIPRNIYLRQGVTCVEDNMVISRPLHHDMLQESQAWPHVMASLTSLASCSSVWSCLPVLSARGGIVLWVRRLQKDPKSISMQTNCAM